MPFYDYICKDCSKIFEIVRGMNEKVQPYCPYCKSSNTTQKFNVFRSMASKGDTFGHESREMSGSCSSCSSGTCSSCSH